jgi:hypothetical protein
MEQRRLRLGDILDDYCPRERRLTNHAVVAMVEETVKQTRCTTCDAEHPYKGGQTPRRRKKEGPSALYKEVLAGKPEDHPIHAGAGEANAVDETEELDAVAGQAASSHARPDKQEDEDARNDADTEEVSQPILTRPAVVTRRDTPPEVPVAAADAGSDADDDRQPVAEEGPVHRQLIRAQLPRIEGFKEERRPTDFTIRQPGGRGGNNAGSSFRGGNDRSRPGGRGGPAGGGFGGNGNNGNANRGNGHRPHGQRFAGARSGQGQGQGQGHGRGQGGGFRSPQQPRQGGGGRKRSR